jgi:hypothetical protein
MKRRNDIERIARPLSPGSQGSERPEPYRPEILDLIARPGGTLYALATVDEKTGGWYLATGASAGNPMRTRDAATVKTWRTREHVYEWLNHLPDRTKREMDRRELYIVAMSLGPDYEQDCEHITIATREVPADPDKPEAGTAAEFDLHTRPLKRRRGRR